jgi:hypothetical protein
MERLWSDAQPGAGGPQAPAAPAAGPSKPAAGAATGPAKAEPDSREGKPLKGEPKPDLDGHGDRKRPRRELLPGAPPPPVPPVPASSLEEAAALAAEEGAARDVYAWQLAVRARASGRPPRPDFDGRVQGTALYSGSAALDS